MSRTTLEFDWRFEASDDTKARVRLTIQDVLDRYQGLDATPKLVIVTQPGISPADETMLADIRAERNMRIGTVTVTENGYGRLYFTPAQ